MTLFALMQLMSAMGGKPTLSRVVPVHDAPPIYTRRFRGRVVGRGSRADVIPVARVSQISEAGLTAVEAQRLSP
jgi:hypothetical protein